MEFTGSQRTLYTLAKTGATELGTALAARVFLHTFLVEHREHGDEPDFLSRVSKKMQKFDARTPKPPKAAQSEAVLTRPTGVPEVALRGDGGVRPSELATGRAPEPQQVSAYSRNLTAH